MLDVQCWVCKEPDCCIHRAEGDGPCITAMEPRDLCLSGLVVEQVKEFSLSISDSTFLLGREVCGQPKSSCGPGRGLGLT